MGGAISASSMATMPRDQMSQRLVYPSGPIFISTAMISGAIQYGVPINDLRLAMVLVSCAETPRSASLTTPASDSRMLPPLMSRWTRCWECR